VIDHVFWQSSVAAQSNAAEKCFYLLKEQNGGTSAGACLLRHSRVAQSSGTSAGAGTCLLGRVEQCCSARAVFLSPLKEQQTDGTND
jgi:hypothetical protein